MNLYVMRHADAGVSRENPVLDARRGLVKEGKQQCILMAGVLTALRVQIDTIISSPLKRARQSAQFVATETGFESPVVTSAALSPEADFAAFQQLISKYSANEGVLVVGHNPNLHQFLARLVSGNGNGNGNGAGGPIRLRKGAIARVDMARRPVQLQWLIDPRLARTIHASVTHGVNVKAAKAKTAKTAKAKTAKAKAAKAKTAKPKK